MPQWVEQVYLTVAPIALVLSEIEKEFIINE